MEDDRARQAPAAAEDAGRPGRPRALRGSVGIRAARATPCWRAAAESCRSRHPPRGASLARMSDPVRFLNAFAQTLGVMTLYPEGHPSRERAVDQSPSTSSTACRGRVDTRVHIPRRRSRVRPRALRDSSPGTGPPADRGGHPAARVRAQGQPGRVRRLPQGGPGAVDAVAIDTCENRQMRSLGIRFGAVGLEGRSEMKRRLIRVSRRWTSRSAKRRRPFAGSSTQVQSNSAVPILEAEAVVRSLSVAMHGDSGWCCRCSSSRSSISTRRRMR